MSFKMICIYICEWWECVWVILHLHLITTFCLEEICWKYWWINRMIHYRIQMNGWQNQTKLKLLVTMNIHLCESRFDVMFAFYHDSFHFQNCLYVIKCCDVCVYNTIFPFCNWTQNTDYGDYIPKWFQNNFFHRVAYNRFNHSTVDYNSSRSRLNCILISLSAYIRVHRVCMFESLKHGNAANSTQCVLWLAEWFS